MFSARKVMSSACMSTNGSEARREMGFTISMLGPRMGVEKCTDPKSSVQPPYTRFLNRCRAICKAESRGLGSKIGFRLRW